jgi:phosphate transport system substrate-binding protein
MALLLIGIGFVGYLPFRYGRKVTLPETFLSRYLPLIAPILYTLAAWVIFVPLGVLEAKESSSWALPFLIPFLPSFPQISLALAFGWRIGLLCILLIPYLFFLLLFALGTWKRGHFATRNNKEARYVLLPIVALLIILGIQEYEWRGRFLSTEQEEIPSLSLEVDPYDDWPFRKENKLTALRAAPAITFRSNYPKLDSATALFPLYAAAVRAIYLEPDEIARSKAVEFSRTPTAYENLITGNADMIFALAPSENQKKRAAEEGLTLTLTPLAKEAFVFLAHEQNPVQNLSLAEIRGIYAGATGYLDFHGNMDLAIAIRTGVIRDKTLSVQAGAGIVADSDPEAEWEETRNKARALLLAAELAEAGLDTKQE